MSPVFGYICTDFEMKKLHFVWCKVIADEAPAVGELGGHVRDLRRDHHEVTQELLVALA